MTSSSADVDRQAHRHRHAVDVEERDGAHHPLFALFERHHPAPHLHGVGHQVEMGEHGGFGHAGGAAGVLEERRVIRGYRDLGRRLRVCVEQLAEGVDAVALRHIHHQPILVQLALDHAVERRRHIVGHVGDDHAFDLRVRLRLLQLAVERAEQHDGFRARVAELVLDLAGRVGGVGVDDDRAQLERAVEADDELRQIGQHQGDAVAFLHAQRGHRRSEPIYLIHQLPVGQRGAHCEWSHVAQDELDRGLVGILGRAVFEGAVQWNLGVVDSVRNFVLVVGQPGLFHMTASCQVGERTARACPALRAGDLPRQIAIAQELCVMWFDYTTARGAVSSVFRNADVILTCPAS